MDEDVKEEEFAPDGDPVDPNYQGILGGEKSDGGLAVATEAPYREDPYMLLGARTTALDSALKIKGDNNWTVDKLIAEAGKLVDFLQGK